MSNRFSRLAQAESNREIYERRAIAAHYAKRSDLHEEEVAAFARYKDQIAGKRILDLGVGGGRTTQALLALSEHYVGVDYSQEMISRSRARFPGVRFEVADARDLADFGNASFDFVLFSNNGIDAVDHADRLTILAEVRRVLAPLGLFVFSSHNRNFEVPKPWDRRHLAINPLRRPVQFGKRLGSVALGLFNYARRTGRDTAEDDYCIRLDSAFSYSLKHYGITVPAQKRQLAGAGFEYVDAVGIDGRFLDAESLETVRDPWVQYVCRRAD